VTVAHPDETSLAKDLVHGSEGHGTRAYRVQVDLLPGQADWRGAALRSEAEALGVAGVTDLRASSVYFLSGSLGHDAVERLAAELLADPIIACYTIEELSDDLGAEVVPDGCWLIEVALLPGVTDAEADSLRSTAGSIGVTGLHAAASATRYVIAGDLSETGVRALAERLLSNPVIQTYTVGRVLPDLSLGRRGVGDRVARLAIREMDDDALLRTSRERVLSLNLTEMHAVRGYFRAEGRDPTDVELETVAQTWSEHCVHKTFRASIDYTERTASGERHQHIDSLLRTYLASATCQLAKPWVLSAFVDNAGIVDFDDETEVSFKVETHNHPSALEPFGGANTGVGGVVRFGTPHRQHRRPVLRLPGLVLR
jgi:phosphoribosylformylglycinamidine (FGAM) synthase PurS component